MSDDDVYLRDDDVYLKGPNRRTVPSTCQTHGGCRGFCNLRLTKVDDTVVLDPHVAGCCVIVLDEDQAIAVRNTLTEWFR